MNDSLLFVSAVSRLDVLRDALLASPCLQPGGHPLVLRWNAASAAEALNPVLDARPPQRWVVWVHQDVWLPPGWDERFVAALALARSRWGDALWVAGVYGLQGAGRHARRAGHVRDRGQWLHEPAELPCRVDSLDELLLAVRSDAPLRADPALGFDFYATDLVLQAQQAGACAAVLDAPCEHRSDTPRDGPMPRSLVQRIKHNGAVFERKWAHRLPVSTPCFEIAQPGDVAAFADRFPLRDPG